MRTGSTGGGGGRGGFMSHKDLHRAAMIDKWMEKKESDAVRRKPIVDFPARKLRKERMGSSSWSSSDSGGFFSSTEAESLRFQRPKPVRTAVTAVTYRRDEFESEQKKHEGGGLSKKSRALKIYSELKKVKQPISPGGKLVGILNSLFAGNQKKQHIIKEDRPSTNTSSTCSSASSSSLSRSCLSKTPSSHGKPKRCVRFSPVSVMVDQDSHPFQMIKKPTPNSQVVSKNIAHQELKNRRVEEAAKDDDDGYLWKTVDLTLDHLNKSPSEEMEQDFEEDDDAASYASSDLFELENLPSIGIKIYNEQLPVYETTSLRTNRAIAKGLLVL